MPKNSLSRLSWSRRAQQALGLRMQPKIKSYRQPFQICRCWHVLETKAIQTGENVTPDFEFCDLAHTKAPADSRNHHLYSGGGPVTPAVGERRVLLEKTKFCAFMFRNFSCATRNQFAEILARHMRVDAAGVLMRCVRDAPAREPHFFPGAINFYRSYKFVIAFENSLGPHYTSEKVWSALRADTVPIYWGNPLIANYLNPERFINAFDFDSLESLARHVMRVHEDDDLYMRYLSAPNTTPRQQRPRFQREGNSEPARRLQRRFKTTRERLRKDRALPLAQRRMFHRECLSRFAHGACNQIVEDRLNLAGWPRRGGVSRRVSVTSRTHVWPHPAFYEVVDMAGQLSVKG